MKNSKFIGILLVLFLLSHIFLLADDRFLDSYKKGCEAMNMQEYSQAIAYFESAIAEEPVSSNKVRDYGVQFVSYHPYTYLVEAYLMWQGPDHLEKARQYADLAVRYKEDDPEKFQELKAKVTRLRRIVDSQIQANTQQEKPSIPLDTVNLLISQGQFHEALDQINLLIHSFPDEAILKSTKHLLRELILKTTTAEKSEQAHKKNLDEFLLKARQSISVDNQETAYLYYLYVDVLDPGNEEAALFIEKFKQNLADQGKTQEEIALELTSYKTENQDLLNRLTELADKNKKIRNELEVLQNQMSQMESATQPVTPQVEVTWDPKPVKDEEREYHLSATINSNIPIESVKFFSNGVLIKTWENIGKSHFKMPTIQNFSFLNYQNRLRLEIRDIRGNIHNDEIPLNIPQSTNKFFQHFPKAFVVFVLFTVSYVYMSRQRKKRQAFRERFNPYVAGAPVFSSSMFYGRHDLLKQILNTLHNNSMMICGERRIGKTTLMHRLHSVLPALDDPEYQFYPVMIDLQGMVEEDFFASMDHEIIDSLAETGIKLPEYWEGTMNVRVFTKRIRQIISELKSHSDRSPKLVLLLDEVDIMNSFSEKTNQQLRSVFMKGFAKHLVAVMAGIHLKKRWDSEGSPWYNFFEQIELQPFTNRHAKALIENPVKGIYSYSDEAEDRILELSNLKPYVIQRLCVNLIATILSENRRRVTRKDVDRVFESIQKEKEQ
ncbi:MAG: hypothetical protein CR997_07960 [Acidobacteria bacterium]|nr:MAG: hypothetical protein CR997_07960 [Acidobacteriota bacterium]